jgi:hypothetical protein
MPHITRISAPKHAQLGGIFDSFTKIAAGFIGGLLWALKQFDPPGG